MSVELLSIIDDILFGYGFVLQQFSFLFLAKGISNGKLVGFFFFFGIRCFKIDIFKRNIFLAMQNEVP